MIVTLKHGVRFDKHSVALGKLLSTLLLLDPKPAWPSVAVVTSGSDGRHSPKSRHYTGEALDVRAHNFMEAEREDFRASYEAALGPQFRVLYEYHGTPSAHFHAQTKKGHIYDPTQD